jgi:hypothetical protein
LGRTETLQVELPPISIIMLEVVAAAALVIELSIAIVVDAIAIAVEPPVAISRTGRIYFPFRILETYVDKKSSNIVPRREVPIYCRIMARVQGNEMQVRRLVGTQPLDMDLSSTQLAQKIASSFRAMTRGQHFSR